jgi:predicted enzyme related to lactoylglutathione lyase
MSMVQLRGTGPAVGLVARDSERMLAFYRDFLALPVDQEVDIPEAGLHVWFFAVGNGFVKLLHMIPTPDRANVGGGRHTATGLRYLTLEITDLDDLLAGLDAAGGQLIGEVREFESSRNAVTEDPEGNTLEFIEYRSESDSELRG